MSSHGLLTINVNGIDKFLSISYADIISLAGERQNRIYTVTYTTRRKSDEQRRGTLTPGQTTLLEPGMVFNVADTGNA